MSLTTAEQMAVAVLKGDMESARGLALFLLDEVGVDSAPVLPIRRIAADHGEMRVIAFTRQPMTNETRQAVEQALVGWWRGAEEGDTVGWVAHHAIERIEVYEMPASQERVSDNPLDGSTNEARHPALVGVHRVQVAEDEDARR